MLKHHKFIIQSFGIVVCLTHNAHDIGYFGQTIEKLDREQKKLAVTSHMVYSIADICRR